MKEIQPTILITDDVQVDLDFLEAILTDQYNIKTATGGAEALATVSGSKIDLILLDVMMKDMDGYKVCKILKSSARTRDIPIIFVTGNTSVDDELRGFELGAVDYITKPFSVTTVKARVKTHVNLYLQKRELANAKKIFQEYKEAMDKSFIVSKTDKKGKITYVNALFCQTSGYTKDELVGNTHKMMRHPDMPHTVFAELWYTIKELKQTWHGEIKNLKKDGSYYWADSFISPVLDTNGEIVEFIALRTDITELEDYKVILENKLDTTNKSLKESINYAKQNEEAINHSMAILKTDASGFVAYVNDSFCALSGYARHALIGKHFQALRQQNAMDVAETQAIQTTLAQKKFINTVFTYLSKDGLPYFVSTTLYPIVNLEGKVIEHLHLMHDISELTNLHLEIQATQKEIVYKMGEIGESRSKETGNHVKRVAEYSRLLALLAGLSEMEAEVLFTASPMHDIGKVAIADSVLNKPGKLTSEEFEIMKNHACIGYEVLRGSKREVLQAAATVAHEHHEKWDGSGYPRGLKGEDIHIYGRITAIADVFDALGHDRVYKKAWELERILALFEEERGRHFDPRLVDLFFDNLDKFLEIRDRLQG